ncbi:MAG: VOC family protein, partial [Anaerolineales bacterium]|nr:VOC family protein [Anaerolineales bacterium]
MKKPPITIGTVALTVANLDASLAFYEEHIGLQVQQRTGAVAYLGVGGPALLRLEERRGARKEMRTTGLYHFALLLPSRIDLALILRHFAQMETVLSGLADHAVSEAIYLSDPDGHGIEIYRDRPRDEWEYIDGQLKLTTEQFDVAGVFDELVGSSRQWAGLPAGTVMGHVHLHVAHISPAEAFYRQLIGLDLVTRYG